MHDVYVLSLNAGEPTTLEEALSLLDGEIDDVPDAVCPRMSGQPSADEPRALVDALGREVLSGSLAGFVAYVGGHPAGVCLYALQGFARARPTMPVVVCLLVGTGYRGLGLAQILLGEVERAIRAVGKGFVEAYPRKPRPGERGGGPLRPFVAAGFVPLGEAGERVVLRKTLGKGRERDSV